MSGRSPKTSGVPSSPLYLHVGLPKTGTTFLQAVLARHRPVLREHGHIYPFVRPEGMFHAAVEVRGQYERWGLPAAEIDGTLAALAARAREMGGTAVLSHEILGGATAEQISSVRQVLGGFDLHVVVTARDLARQVVAHWQEQVKNGQIYSFEEFRREVVQPGVTGREDEFWAEQDLIDVLDRWGAGLEPSHVHVVVCPPSRASAHVLWQRFATAVALDPAVAVLDEEQRNDSLGAVEVALLRRVNEQLRPRMEWTDYAHTVKRWFAHQVLPGSSKRLLTPPDLQDTLAATTMRWQAEIRDRGYAVHGDLEELAPVDFSPRGESPDDVDDAALARRGVGLLADLLQAEATRRAAEGGAPGEPVREPRSGRPARRRERG